MSGVGDSLGDRMKAYEAPWRAVMTRRVPVIIRVDGKAFHTFARGCARPFDAGLMSAMDAVAVELCKEIQGAQLAYVQSDEVSVLVHGYRTIQTQPWVNNEVQKMVSLTASVATAAFSDAWAERTQSRALFDSRVFLVPEDEVCNYFIWRQQDATRNSIQMTARAHFSDKACFGKSCEQLQEMLFSDHGINWNDMAIGEKRGRCVLRGISETNAIRSVWITDHAVPVFAAARDYIERHVRIQQEDEGSTEAP